MPELQGSVEAESALENSSHVTVKMKKFGGSSELHVEDASKKAATMANEGTGTRRQIRRWKFWCRCSCKEL